MSEPKLWKDMTPNEQKVAEDEYAGRLNKSLRESTLVGVKVFAILLVINLIVRACQ